MSDPNDPNEQQEPSMEEILASIRRIISEDDVEMDDDEAEAAKRAEASGQAPAAEAQEPLEGEAEAEEVLELTEMIEEDGSVVSVAKDQEPEDEAPEAPVSDAPEAPQPETPEPETPEPETPEPETPEPETLAPEMPQPEAPQPVSAADWPDDTLVSEDVGAQTASAFLNLSRTVVAGYEGDGKTLEDLVEAMLRPMLKSWLDENLPRLVEKLVAEEIARLASKR